jgi:hypothetical protein
LSFLPSFSILNAQTIDEKMASHITQADINDDKVTSYKPQYHEEDAPSVKGEILESHEVFQQTDEGVQFRTVSWQRATIIFLKIQFAMSILSVPGALATLGAVGGGLSLVGWHTLNTCRSTPWSLRSSFG